LQLFGHGKTSPIALVARFAPFRFWRAIIFAGLAGIRKLISGIPVGMFHGKRMLPPLIGGALSLLVVDPLLYIAFVIENPATDFQVDRAAALDAPGVERLALKAQALRRFLDC
jgi:hypothetical protein